MTRRDFSRRALLTRGGALGVTGMLLPGAAWPQSRERDVEGGIGGTGIVGVLTDFGSLIVGGKRVMQTASTRYSDDFGPLAAADMALGQSLTVEAATRSGQLVAERVHVTYPLVGQVSSNQLNGRALVVNGVAVRLERGVRSVQVGDRVAVSGLWRGTEVIASAVVPAPNTLDAISGTAGTRNGRRIGPVAMRGRGTQALREGGYGAAVGVYVPGQGRFVAERVETARFTGAAGPLARLEVEGFLEAAPQDRAGHRVAGLGHSFEPGPDFAQFRTRRVLLGGDYTGLFAVRRATYLAENPVERRRLLRQRAQ